MFLDIIYYLSLFRFDTLTMNEMTFILVYEPMKYMKNLWFLLEN